MWTAESDWLARRAPALAAALALLAPFAGLAGLALAGLGGGQRPGSVVGLAVASVVCACVAALLLARLRLAPVLGFVGAALAWVAGRFAASLVAGEGSVSAPGQALWLPAGLLLASAALAVFRRDAFGAGLDAALPRLAAEGLAAQVRQGRRGGALAGLALLLGGLLVLGLLPAPLLASTVALAAALAGGGLLGAALGLPDEDELAPPPPPPPGPPSILQPLR